MVDIFQIILGPLLHFIQRIRFSPVVVDLRPTGYSRPYFMAQHIPVNYFSVFFIQRHRVRPGSYNGHSALQNVDELGEFVQRPFPQYPSHWRQTLIIGLDLAEARIIIRGSERPEFPYYEFLSIKSVTVLFVYHWTF